MGFLSVLHNVKLQVEDSCSMKGTDERHCCVEFHIYWREAQLLWLFWQRFLTEPFLQKVCFLFLEILTSKQTVQVLLFSFWLRILRKRKYNFLRNGQKLLSNDDNNNGITGHGDTKSEGFLHKNEHTQRKFLNFENWTNGDPQ